MALVLCFRIFKVTKGEEERGKEGKGIEEEGDEEKGKERAKKNEKLGLIKIPKCTVFHQKRREKEESKQRRRRTRSNAGDTNPVREITANRTTHN